MVEARSHIREGVGAKPWMEHFKNIIFRQALFETTLFIRSVLTFQSCLKGFFCSVLRIRIRMCLSLLDPDPDPLVRGMDPDPFITMLK